MTGVQTCALPIWDAPLDIRIDIAAGHFHVGKTLYAGVRLGDGNRFSISKASVTKADITNANSAPQLLVSPDTLNFEIQVGEVGFNRSFECIVRDPEGNLIDYTLLRGPDWVYIQNNESLFSNFGPPESEAGKEFDCLIEAKAPKGQSMQFTIKLTVVR